MAAAAFLRNLIAAVPYKLHIVLTEPSLVRHWFNPNGGGMRFADHERHIHAFEHIFGRICREHQIDHRPTKITPPWSREDKKTIRGIVFPNGQIERIPLTVCRQTVAGQRNLTIKEATVKRFHYDDHDQLRNHLAKFAYRGPAVQQRL